MTFTPAETGSILNNGSISRPQHHQLEPVTCILSSKGNEYSILASSMLLVSISENKESPYPGSMSSSSSYASSIGSESNTLQHLPRISGWGNSQSRTNYGCLSAMVQEQNKSSVAAPQSQMMVTNGVNIRHTEESDDWGYFVDSMEGI